MFGSGLRSLYLKVRVLGLGWFGVLLLGLSIHLKVRVLGLRWFSVLFLDLGYLRSI